MMYRLQRMVSTVRTLRLTERQARDVIALMRSREAMRDGQHARLIAIYCVMP